MYVRFANQARRRLGLFSLTCPRSEKWWLKYGMQNTLEPKLTAIQHDSFKAVFFAAGLE